MGVAGCNRQKKRCATRQRDVHKLDKRDTAEWHARYYCQSSKHILSQANSERCCSQHVWLLAFIFKMDQRSALGSLLIPILIRRLKEYFAGIWPYVDVKRGG